MMTQRHTRSSGHPPGYIVLFLILIALITFLFVSSDPIDHYIEAVKTAASQNIDEDLNEDQLLKEINSLRQSIDVSPVDARIDRVWKAIPGYNGLEVDVQKSYLLAQQLGRVDLNRLVINEVEPKVGLADIQPAPVYRGNQNKPAAALMINVAWGTEHIPSLLDVLEQYHVKATFFLDGQWLNRHEEVARKMIEHGHEIGNHAYSHPDMRHLTIQEIHDEIGKTEQLIEQLGVRSHFFAPPAGAYDDRVVRVAREFNMYTVLWTLDTLDWKQPAPNEMIQRIIPRLENGALILMHPTQPTVEALPRLIEGIREQEIEPGTVSEVLSSSRMISIVRVE